MNNQTTDILASIKQTVLSRYEQSNFLLDKKTNIITLTEDASNAKCKEIKFEINGEILIYKFDKKDPEIKDNHPLLFLEKTPPLRSLADYIIFYHRNTKKENKQLYAIICNMKSENPSNMEDQMLSGVILADFIYKTAVRCHNNWNSNDSNKISVENIIFKEIAVYSEIKSPKGKMKPQNSTKQRTTLKCNNKVAYNLDTRI